MIYLLNHQYSSLIQVLSKALELSKEIRDCNGEGADLSYGCKYCYDKSQILTKELEECLNSFSLNSS